MNIVSFYAPRPDHPFFQDYTPFLDILRESCARFGHRHIVLTDDAAVGDDAYVAQLPQSLMKAVLAAQYAYLSDPQFADTPTLLTGADCVLANDPAEAFRVADFDLGITVGPFLDCRMNTGAIFIPRPQLVAEIWAEALAHCGDDWGDDQTSLLRAIEQRPTHGLWSAKVHEFPVDPWNLAPEHPADDCRRGVVLHFRGPRKAWMQNYCFDRLGLGTPIIACALPNVSDDTMLANIETSSRLGLPWVGPTEAHDRVAVICGGGPSLADCVDELRARKEAGHTIFALNGAGDFLARNGVVPDYVVILDARPENARFVTARESVYLLASQCSPAVFGCLDGRKAMIWHAAMPGLAERLPHDGTQVRADITVGLSAPCLAFLMGYRDLHLYGYDSSERGDVGHAYEQNRTAEESRHVEAWAGSERFVTTIAMFEQTRKFPEMATVLNGAGADITLHGSGLLPSYVRALAEQQTERKIAA